MGLKLTARWQNQIPITHKLCNMMDHEIGWQEELKSPDFRYTGDSLFSAKSLGKNFIHATSGLAKDRLLS